jgi:hypothetical protein
MKFAHGELHSEARLDLELDSPQSLAQLLPLLSEAAISGGFLHSKGREGIYSLEELYSESFSGSVSALLWVKTPNSKSVEEGVMFLLDLKMDGEFDRELYARTGKASTFTFVFEKGSTDSFTKEDWVTYFKYKDEILPRVFPNAKISVTKRRHPAVFTDDDILRQIQRETDFEIPEKYLPAPEGSEVIEES